MNKKVIIICSAVLAAVLILGGVILATVLKNDGDDDVGSDTLAPDEAEYFLDLFSSGATEYVLVRSDNAGEGERVAALEFSKYFKAVTGADIELTTDFTEKVPKEIVIGETNRVQLDTAMINGGAGGFIITVDGERLIICGSNPEWTLMGVRKFFEGQLDGKIIDGEHYTLEAREQISVSSKISERLSSVMYYSTEQYDYDGLLLLGRSVVSYDRHADADSDVFVSANGKFTGHICLSDDRAVELAKADILEYLAEHKELKRITVKQSGADGACSCAECSRHSSLDAAILFMNKLAAAFGSDRNFDLVFYADAYGDITPTEKTEGYSVLLANEQQLMNLSEVQWRFNFFTQRIAAWSEVSDSIYVASAYVVMKGEYSHQQLLESMPNYKMLSANLEKLVDMNVKALYETAAWQKVGSSDTTVLYELREDILRAMAAGLSLTSEEYLNVMLPSHVGNATADMIEYLAYLSDVRNQKEYPLATLDGDGISVGCTGRYYLNDEQISKLDSVRRNIIKNSPSNMTDIMRSLIPATAHSNVNDDWKYREIFTCYLDVKQTQVYSFNANFNNYTAIAAGTKTSFFVDDMAMGHLIHSKKPASVEMFTLSFTEGYHEFSIAQTYASVSLNATVDIAPDEMPELPTPSATLANPNASEEAKAVYEYLLEIYGKRTLIGQHDRKSGLAALASFEKLNGDYPAIPGFELMSYSGNIPTDSDSDAFAEYEENVGLIDDAIAYLKKRGGIPTLTWHWYAPIGGQGKSFYTDQAGGFSVARAVTVGTAEYNATLRDIDLIAEQLKRFEAEGIPVLWRPLHEADGAWFWWGSGGADSCVKLWKLMYERLVEYHGLDNLIWVWNSGRTFSAEWYPGNEYVDMVSVDTYVEPWNYGSLAYTYNAMLSGCKNNGVNKLIALAECGSAPNVDASIAAGVAWSYQFTFNQQDYYKTRTSDAHYRYLANSECAVMLSELPEQFRRW